MWHILITKRMLFIGNLNFRSNLAEYLATMMTEVNITVNTNAMQYNIAWVGNVNRKI